MKSADKFDHPDFVGGIVWSEIELDWIRNRDEKWERKLAASEADRLRLREALHSISLCEKASTSSREEMGKLAREALASKVLK